MDAISPIDETDSRRSFEIESIAKQRTAAVLIVNPEINSASPFTQRLRRDGLDVFSLPRYPTSVRLAPGIA